MTRFDWWKTGNTPPRFEDPPNEPDDDSDADTVPEPTPILIDPEDPGEHLEPKPDLGGESGNDA